MRDMPLTRSGTTAAAAWLAAGNSLMYVQRQLGHADISTTERYYGHLERHVLAAGAVATEEAIARASKFEWISGIGADDLFGELDRDALMFMLDDVPVRYCSLEHLRAMKNAAGRPRDVDDLQHLPDR